MMDKTPVYKYPAFYARENDELEQYRASYKANVACKNAIETAIRDNYRDNCLGKEAVKQVADQFGYERMFFVLANTVQRKDFDGRISHYNKDWAKTIHVFEDKNYFGEDRRSSFEVDSVNPGLTDIFINQARREYLLTQPLSKEDIQKEAGQILRRLQAEREPNSPSGTHFMAQISPDFLIRASTKDHDRLFALLPFKSLTFSTLKDQKGIFAFIQKDENRDQPLRVRKPSVKKQLQAKPTERKSPRKPEMER
jgi:hypothetical protein